MFLYSNSRALSMLHIKNNRMKAYRVYQLMIYIFFVLISFAHKILTYDSLL